MQFQPNVLTGISSKPVMLVPQGYLTCNDGRFLG